jgi:hypothetical protein
MPRFFIANRRKRAVQRQPKDVRVVEQRQPSWSRSNSAAGKGFRTHICLLLLRTYELNTIVQAVESWIRLCVKNEYLTVNEVWVKNGWEQCHKLIRCVANMKPYVHRDSIAMQSLQSKLAAITPPVQWQPTDVCKSQRHCSSSLVDVFWEEKQISP